MAIGELDVSLNDLRVEVETAQQLKLDLAILAEAFSAKEAELEAVAARLEGADEREAELQAQVEAAEDVMSGLKVRLARGWGWDGGTSLAAWTQRADGVVWRVQDRGYAEGLGCCLQARMVGNGEPLGWRLRHKAGCGVTGIVASCRRGHPAAQTALTDLQASSTEMAERFETLEATLRARGEALAEAEARAEEAARKLAEAQEQVAGLQDQLSANTEVRRGGGGVRETGVRRKGPTHHVWSAQGRNLARLQRPWTDASELSLAYVCGGADALGDGVRAVGGAGGGGEPAHGGADAE